MAFSHGDIVQTMGCSVLAQLAESRTVDILNIEGFAPLFPVVSKRGVPHIAGK